MSRHSSGTPARKVHADAFPLTKMIQMGINLATVWLWYIQDLKVNILEELFEWQLEQPW